MAGRILIVDDSIDNRKLLMKTLARHGHEVVEACDGKEALARSLEILPDLILLDIVMPGIDGYQVCSALKDDERTADIPVIFLSAKSEVKDKIRGLEIGGVDYITKPFDRGEVLARVQNQLKIRALMKDLMDKQARLDEDLKAAAAIQRSLLPQKFPDVENVEIAWKFVPCERIGGDIFNVFRLDESHLGFYILDVSGHGVPSAMLTVSVSQMLQPHSGYLSKKQTEVFPFYQIVSPREVLDTLDREYPIDRFDKYFTIVYMVLNVHTGHLRYSNAAHPCPILLHPDGKLDLLDRGGTIIGLDGIVPFEEGELDLQCGDKLFFYTDGLTEYQNDEGQFYGEDRFNALLVSLKDQPVGVALEFVYESLMQFGNQAKLQDDVSLLGVEFKGKEMVSG
jgi:sigma-B regulation protein RsbU (phosphoserine phosphatase)